MLSPSTARMRRIDKLPFYAEFGVAHAWLVVPDIQTLECYSLHQSHWLLEAAGGR